MGQDRQLSPLAFEFVAFSAATLIPIAFIYFRLDLRSFDVPAVYVGDTPWMFLSMKNVLQFGWPTINPNLGFPFGSDAALEPIHPTDTILLMRTVATVTGDPIVASNLFIYLSHVVNAAIAYACFRVLRLGHIISVIGAVSFAFLEFGVHPGRVYGHQSLALFGSLAVAATLSLLPFRYGRDWPQPLFWVSCLGAIIIGFSHPYYIAFSAMVIMISAVMLLSCTRIKDFSFAIAMLLVIAAAMVVAWFGPTLIADIDIPYSAPERHWVWQSTLGIRVPDLVMPPRSSIAWLKDARQSYYAIMNGTFDTYLGVVGVFGAVVAILLALRVPLLRKAPLEEADTISAASLLALFCFAFGMTNGLGLLFSMTITPTLRAQDRIIPLLAFYCIYVAVCAIGRWGEGVARRARRAAIIACAAVAAFIGLLDQTTGLSYATLQSQLSPLYHNDRQFFAELEQVLPPRTAVMQLPPMFLPEDDTYVATGLGIYEQLRGPTYTNTLRWSFGLSIDNQGYLTQLFNDARQTVYLAHARGFGAILVYKSGYGDRGAALTQQIANLLAGKPVLDTSEYVAFLLPSRPIEQSGHGHVVTFWQGLRQFEVSGDRRFRWDDSADGTVTLFVNNHKDRAANLRFSGFLVPALNGKYRGTFSVDNETENFVVDPSGLDLSRNIVLAPGRHRITIHVDVPAYKPSLAVTRPPHFRLIEPNLTDVEEIETLKAVASAYSDRTLGANRDGESGALSTPPKP